MTQYFTPRPPRALAHRGLAVNAPENSMLAFALALDAGADYIETDVRATACGVAVVVHDASLRRVAGIDQRVSDMHLAELQRIQLGESQSIPLLRDVLMAFPDTRFNIDIKSRDAVIPTVRAITEAKAQQRVLLTSFADRTRRAAVRLLPGVATSASQAGVVRALIAAQLQSTGLLTRALRGIHALQIPETAGPVALVTDRTVRALHSVGVEVHVWTVNDPADMHRLLDLGVDGLVTDRVDVARAVISERAAAGL